MANFIKHEPCPRCREAGGDRTGNNLARYDNGGAFCFSCHYLERPTSFVPRNDDKEGKEPPSDLCKQFHEDNLRWLRKFLLDQEIMDWFWYSPSEKRHVFKWADYWEARSVNPEAKRKTISHGTKPFLVLGKGDNLVVVEDVVSAIKVSRVARAVPLFGSHISPEWMVKLVKERPKKILIWLDYDKKFEARQFADKINRLAPICSTIATPFDPKLYTEEEIRKKLT